MKRFFIRINYLSVVLIYFTFQNISILKAEVHNTPELKVKKEPALGLQNDAGKKIDGSVDIAGRETGRRRKVVVRPRGSDRYN